MEEHTFYPMIRFFAFMSYLVICLFSWQEILPLDDRGLIENYENICSFGVFLAVTGHYAFSILERYKE